MQIFELAGPVADQMSFQPDAERPAKPGEAVIECSADGGAGVIETGPVPAMLIPATLQARSGSSGKRLEAGVVMHKLLIRSVALATLLAGPAMAADIAVPVYQPPRPVAFVPFSWEGCYLGVNAGWTTQRLDNTLSVTNGDVPFFLPADLPIINASGTGGLQSNGFTGGVQGGCNIQMSSFVWGFEGDVNYLRQDDQFSGTFLRSAAIPFVMTVSERKNWLATVRARVGFAADQWYFYLTGGGAALGFHFEQTYWQTTLAGTFTETPPSKTGLDGPWARASWVRQARALLAATFGQDWGRANSSGARRSSRERWCALTAY